MSRLWTPKAGELSIPGVWLPPSQQRPALEHRVPNRREIRTFLHTRKVREDGSPFTKPSIATRRALRRRQRKAAK